MKYIGTRYLLTSQFTKYAKTLPPPPPPPLPALDHPPLLSLNKFKTCSEPLGNVLKTKRMAQHLSLAELLAMILKDNAKLLGHVTLEHLRAIEENKHLPCNNTWQALCRILNLETSLQSATYFHHPLGS